MITNNEAQTGIVAWLKDNTTITDLHANYPAEIREGMWQGEDFEYPNIRVSCEITPVASGCTGPDTCEMTISCFSLEKSSLQSQAHAGTIANELHNKGFTKSGVKYGAIRVLKTPRAILEDSIWQASVQVTMNVS